MKNTINVNTFSLNSTWLHGKYAKVEAEINTKIPYVSIGEHYWQGDEADNVIEEIHKIYISGDLTPEKAIKKYQFLYLS